MVRQAQGYFAAAVAAAVINAAAIAAFVLITVLSSIHALPLTGLLNASSPFQTSSGDSSPAPATDLFSGGLAALDRRSSDFAVSDRGAGGGSENPSYETRGSDGNPGHIAASAGPGGPSSPEAGGSTDAGGSAPSGSGPTANGSSPTPTLPVRPPSQSGGSVGQAVQQVGNAASGSASDAQATVGATVTTATGVVAGATKAAPSAPAPVKAAGDLVNGVVAGAVKSVPSGPKPGVKAGGSPLKNLPALP